mmetsp:Transcript_100053/g.149949  ORF Transcript_100053/g.149949 Transcript_100053/m.149949 type:complete len:252 (-) Transcript_100053:937-1692(-)
MRCVRRLGGDIFLNTVDSFLPIGGANTAMSGAFEEADQHFETGNGVLHDQDAFWYGHVFGTIRNARGRNGRIVLVFQFSPGRAVFVEWQFDGEAGAVSNSFRVSHNVTAVLFDDALGNAETESATSSVLEFVRVELNSFSKELTELVFGKTDTTILDNDSDGTISWLNVGTFATLIFCHTHGLGIWQSIWNVMGADVDDSFGRSEFEGVTDKIAHDLSEADVISNDGPCRRRGAKPASFEVLLVVISVAVR